MTKQSTLYLTLSVVCFGLVWAIYEQLLSRLVLQGEEEPVRWIGFLSAMGLFVLLFQITLRVSHAAFRTWLSNESRLAGSWFQVFQIHNYTKSTDPEDAIRHGPVKIVLGDAGLEITAENRKVPEPSAPSSWHSDKVSIQGSQVWLLFSSTGPGRGSTHGNMLFHSQAERRLTKKTVRLVGQFADSSPATHFGSIELFRSETEYRERLEGMKSSPAPVADAPQ